MAAGGDDGWKDALLSQLKTRNVLQDGFFREVLTVHGQTSSDERQYRRVAQTAPPSEVHSAVLLENADLQRRLQQAEQQVEALSAENASLKEKILESKQRDAETLNELTGNLEYYRQQEVADAAAAAAAAAATADATVSPIVSAPEVEAEQISSSVEPVQQSAGEAELPLPPVVGMVEIVETGSGHDEFTGQEYTTYVMRCKAAVAPGDQTPSDASETARVDESTDTNAPVEWSVSKRFSDFSNLRAELAALPTIGAVVETMDFPPSTWNFLPWGAGKMDQETIAARRSGLQGWLNSVLGTFPTEAAVRRFLQDPASAAAAAEPEPEPEQPELIALWSFEPPTGQDDTHVALQKGDRVRLLKEVSADWWFVEVCSSGKRGYVPATYVQAP